jgi:hypothetical protein
MRNLFTATLFARPQLREGWTIFAQSPRDLRRLTANFGEEKGVGSKKLSAEEVSANLELREAFHASRRPWHSLREFVLASKRHQFDSVLN